MSKDWEKAISKIKNAGGRVYLVGGAVRDKLLGIAPCDYDFCITGLTIKQMQKMFPYAKKSDYFPIFRMKGAEFSLAVKSRKKRATGKYEIYTSPKITIEEDLKRRDITINSMAFDVTNEYMPKDPVLIDPYNGRKDLNIGLIRALKSFDIDPLRAYRAIRLAAKYNLNIEPKTIGYIKKVKEKLSLIVRSLIYAEFIKVLKADNPDRFFKFLKKLNLLEVHFGVLNDMDEKRFLRTMSLLRRTAWLTDDSSIRLLALTQLMSEGQIREFCVFAGIPAEQYNSIVKYKQNGILEHIRRSRGYRNITLDTLHRLVSDDRLLLFKKICNLTSDKLTQFAALCFRLISWKVKKLCRITKNPEDSISHILQASKLIERGLQFNKMNIKSKLRYLEDLERSFIGVYRIDLIVRTINLDIDIRSIYNSMRNEVDISKFIKKYKYNRLFVHQKRIEWLKSKYSEKNKDKTHAVIMNGG